MRTPAILFLACLVLLTSYISSHWSDRYLFLTHCPDESRCECVDNDCTVMAYRVQP